MVALSEYIRRRFLMPHFGNSLGLGLNLRYRKHLSECRTVGPGVTDQAARDLAANVEADGAALIENAIGAGLARLMSDRISQLIAREPDDKQRRRTAHLQYRVNHPIKILGSDVLDLFRGPADGVLRAYFGSFYKLHSVACYRSVPSDDPQGAWLWHIDNNAPTVKKIMLYLTDCDLVRGATSFLSPATTAALQRSGYFGIGPDERSEDLSRFAAKAAIKVEPYTPTIRAGSALLFDNNSLHRANIPRSGYRDVVTFSIMPSRIPWDQWVDREGIEAVEKRHSPYPEDPRRQ